MREGLGTEMLGIAEGAAAVELGPDVVRSVFGSLSNAAGAKVEFMPQELGGLGGAVEHGVDLAKAAVPIVATVLLIEAGLRHMFQAAEGKSKRK